MSGSATTTCEVNSFLSTRLSLISRTAAANTSRTAALPPVVPHDGIRVLQPVQNELKQCTPANQSAKHSTLRQVGRLDLTHGDGRVDNEDSFLRNGRLHSQPRGRDASITRARLRKAFVCSAGCSAREPQLEISLAPWADWQKNFSGVTMLKTLNGFCLAQAQRDSQDPFIIAVLWRGDVYYKTCGVENVWDSGLYLIGPEDLSLVTVFLLGIQRLAALPPGPIAFGMYLSDYTSLVDHHLIGPGLPMFAYLSRDTSWAIPWPSSFTAFSTQEVERLQAESASHSKGSLTKPWSMKSSKAYWIGAVTGPWQFQMDAGLEAVPRLKFLRLAKKNPQQLEAEWTHLADYGISWVEDDELHVSGFMATRPRTVEEMTGIQRSEYKPTEKWMNYKYYANLDGVVLGGRLSKLMALGGVVLQHQAGYIEHLDALIKPYEHYVPVAYDLSDLVSKVEWLQKNDAEAQRIAERAQSLATKRMRLEDHICYIWRALEALGAKTASADVEVDESQVDEYLKGQFKKAAVKKGGMRPTLESFWGTKLEDVITGSRQMDPSGIEMLQWVWDRLEKLHHEVHQDVFGSGHHG